MKINIVQEEAPRIKISSVIAIDDKVIKKDGPIIAMVTGYSHETRLIMLNVSGVPYFSGDPVPLNVLRDQIRGIGKGKWELIPPEKVALTVSTTMQF